MGLLAPSGAAGRVRRERHDEIVNSITPLRPAAALRLPRALRSPQPAGRLHYATLSEPLAPCLHKNSDGLAEVYALCGYSVGTAGLFAVAARNTTQPHASRPAAGRRRGATLCLASHQIGPGGQSQTDTAETRQTAPKSARATLRYATRHDAQHHHFLPLTLTRTLTGSEAREHTGPAPHLHHAHTHTRTPTSTCTPAHERAERHPLNGRFPNPA